MYIPYPEDVLKKLQKEELEVLKAFAALCEKHGIKWFPSGGTLLGAVRHSGFIPWDDDIDVYLLKEDYEKFINIPKEEYEEKYSFISPDTENGYYNLIPKFYKKNTEFVTSRTEIGGGKRVGIFIEIFPVTYVSDNAKIRKKHYKKARIFSIMLHETTLPHIINGADPFKKTPFWEKIIRVGIRVLFRCIHLTDAKINRWYVKWYNKAVSPVPTHTMTQYCYSPHSESYIFSPDNLFPLREMVFEDMKIPVPNKTEQILTGYYGIDFMELPPPEKRWNQCPSFIRFSDGTEYDFMNER